MAKAETDIAHQIMIDLAPMGVRLFKNVRGLFLSLDGKRKIKAGLTPNGASDLIGFSMVKITADMVGKELPIFTAIETKTADGGNGSEDQKKYIAALKRYNTYVGIARNTLDAIKIVNK